MESSFKNSSGNNVSERWNEIRGTSFRLPAKFIFSSNTRVSNVPRKLAESRGLKIVKSQASKLEIFKCSNLETLKFRDFNVAACLRCLKFGDESRDFGFAESFLRLLAFRSIDDPWNLKFREIWGFLNIPRGSEFQIRWEIRGISGLAVLEFSNGFTKEISPWISALWDFKRISESQDPRSVKYLRLLCSSVNCELSMFLSFKIRKSQYL